jgi:hypothetical protein
MTSTADDPISAYFTQMAEESAKHLGELGGATTKAVLDADRFDWRPPATQAEIAARFRALPADTDFADSLTRVICDTYSDHQFPHDPGAVRQAVTRHLDRDTDG